MANVAVAMSGKTLTIDGKTAAQATPRAFAALQRNVANFFGADIVGRVVKSYPNRETAIRKLVRMGGPGFLPAVPIQKMVWSNNSPPLSYRVDQLEKAALVGKVSAALRAH